MRYTRHNALKSPFYAWLVQRRLAPRTAYQYASALYRLLDHRERLDDAHLEKELLKLTPQSRTVMSLAWRNYVEFAQETGEVLPVIPGFTAIGEAPLPPSLEPILPVLSCFVAHIPSEQIPMKLLQPIMLHDLHEYPRRPGHVAYRNPPSGGGRPWDGCHYPIPMDVLETYITRYLATGAKPSPLLFPNFPGSDQPLSEKELTALTNLIRSRRAE